MLTAVDIGNTSIGVGVFETENLTHHSRIRIQESIDLQIHELNHSLAGFFQKKSPVAVASVNPRTEEIFCDWLKKNHGITPLKVGTDIPIKTPILTKNPERVGVDRLLNAVAAFQRLRTGTLVVDFGTAITVDVVSDKGEYLGGVIAPGIETSTYALNARTAFLPRVTINKPSHALGKDTEEAISSGIYWGTVGMVERILKELFNELGHQPKVIATGGDAELFATDITLISEIIPHLSLEGIRIAHAQSH